jgi:hypothetical protein
MIRLGNGLELRGVPRELTKQEEDLDIEFEKIHSERKERKRKAKAA